MENLLNKAGIATFRFDFFGHGESEGEFENVTVSQGVEDILNAHRFLESLGFEKIGLVGSSYGGATAILAAVKLPDLFALALKCPVSDYEELEMETKGTQRIEEWKEKGFEEYESADGSKLKLNYTFFEDLKNNNGLEVACEILAPTLIVHGDADEDVPASQSIRLSQQISECDLEIMEGADHRFSDPDHFHDMIKFVLEFVVERADQ